MEKPFNLYEKLYKELTDSGFNIKDKTPEVPGEVKSFLGKLSMLFDVPTHYLIPEEKMLPKFLEQTEEEANNGIAKECGALRFFSIDPYWVHALLNGALNVGPGYNSTGIFNKGTKAGEPPKINLSESQDTSFLLNQAMNGHFLAEVFQQELITRVKAQMGNNYDADTFEAEFKKRLVNLGIDVEKIKDLNNPPTAAPTIAQMNWRYSGFILRSTLVSTWQDLEVVAHGKIAPADENEPILRVIRMEKLAYDTMLYICEGLITRVVIKQPPESFHFGFEEKAGEKSKYMKKYMNREVEVSMRSNSDLKGIINIKKLADDLPTQHSATFAEAMVAAPIHNSIILKVSE